MLPRPWRSGPWFPLVLLVACASLLVAAVRSTTMSAAGGPTSTASQAPSADETSADTVPDMLLPHLLAELAPPGLDPGQQLPPLPGATPSWTARITQDFAPIHTAPAESAPVVWRLYEGAQISVVGEPVSGNEGAWHPVRLWNSANGWVADEHISFDPYPPPPTPAPRPAQAAAPTPAPPSPGPPRAIA